MSCMLQACCQNGRARTASTQSRSCWDLSPWMERAGQPSVRSWRVTLSQPRLVSQKMSSRRPSISRSSRRTSMLYLSPSPMNSKACSIMWLACTIDIGQFLQAQPTVFLQ